MLGEGRLQLLDPALRNRNTACSWLPGRRYREAWAALEIAKALHYLGHTYRLRDFQVMVDEVAVLFPGPEKLRTAVTADSADAELGRAGSAVGEAPAATDQPQSSPLGGVAWLQRLFMQLRRRWSGSHADAGGNDTVAQQSAPGGQEAVGVEQEGGSGGSGEGDMVPIFVVGLPRSGSTLVEQILAR
jgi:hypothetical protein